VDRAPRPPLRLAEQRALAHLDDWALVHRLRVGDDGAMDELLHRHWRETLAFARRMVREPDVADDVAQAVFVRLWEYRDRWTPRASVRVLLLRLARNLALNEIRAWRRRLRVAATLLRGSGRDPPTPLQDALAGDLSAAVDHAIAALSPRRREVFVLSRHHDLSYQDIAKVTGSSPQTVANNMSAALRELRRRLAPFIA
jgi:RNA polymerase sigma-70 factor (ECF subfamily)